MLIMSNSETYSFQLYRLVQLMVSNVGECWTGKWCHLLKQRSGSILTTSSFWRMWGIDFSQKCAPQGLWDDSQVFNSQTDDLNSSPWTHMVEGKNQFLNVVLWLPSHAWYGFPCEHFKNVHLHAANTLWFNLISPFSQRQKTVHMCLSYPTSPWRRN